MYREALFLHLLFAAVWVGGMVFALIFARQTSEEVLRRFVYGSWLSAAVLFLTGMWMWHSFRRDFFENPLFHVKLFLFGVMVLNLAYISFFLMRRGLLRQVGHFMWINLFLGVLVILVISYLR